MQPYRKRLVGLPFQRSLFSEIAKGPALIELGDLFPGGQFGVRLDQEGDLYLDKADIERVGAELPRRLNPELLERIELPHRRACTTLLEETERSFSVARSGDRSAIRAALLRQAAGIAAVFPYGILTKFVPDILFRAYSSSPEGENNQPPFPVPSAGAELSEALLRLALACAERGYDPQRISASGEAELPAEIAKMIGEFCAEAAGFGSLAWESPGYEDPAYVAATMGAAFGVIDLDSLRRRLKPATPPVSAVVESSILRRVLSLWLDFLERETWYVRRAFYRGALPLLVELARERTGRPPEEVLFLTIEELADTEPEQRTLDGRVERYWGDAAYLAKHGVERDRLSRMMKLSG